MELNISGTYKTQHGDLTLSQNGDNIIGTYQENGICSGKLSGNKVEGFWKNKKDQGLFEWNFSDEGSFTGKYKSGLEKGPMRGKWDGRLNFKSELKTTNIENSEEKEVVIEISGRIPKYFFGSLKEVFKEEIKNVLEYCSEELSTEEEFLQILLRMTLEDKESVREDFFSYIEESDLEDNFPNLFRLVVDIEENDFDHFALYEQLFDTAEYWDGGTGFISFFESDSNIRVLVDNKEIIPKLKLNSFFESVEDGNSEDGTKNEFFESFLKKNNEQWGFVEPLFYAKNQHGSYLVENWFSPQSLNEISELENSVTIEHDDIITYSYTIWTNDFKFSDLLFLVHSNYSDFRQSSETTKFNFLFYKNEIVTPDESWERDKGITLKFNPKIESLSFLLNG